MTQTDKIHLKELLDALEAQYHAWGHALPLGGITLRTRFEETTGLPDNALPAFIQKPVEQMSIFERFYTDLFKFIHDYEQTTPIRLPDDEQHLQELKTILKKHEKKQDAIHLRQAVVAYRASMEVHPFTQYFMQLFKPTSLLADQLDELLNQLHYQESSLYTAEHQAQRVVINQIEERLKPSTESPYVFTQIPVSPIISNAVELDWISNPMEKSIALLKEDMAILRRYQTDPPIFKQQVLGYFYYFVSALAHLPSKAAFETKLPLFRYVITELTQLDHNKAVNLEGFLHPLRIAETNLLKPLYRNQWTFFVKNHFEIICDRLHQKYPMLPSKLEGLPVVAERNATLLPEPSLTASIHL